MAEVRHVVVLMLENRSFDKMLGCLRAELGVDGIDPANPGTNLDDGGQSFQQLPTQATQTDPDPMHELVNVQRQIRNQNSGFVLDYALSYPNVTVQQRQEIMSYYDRDFLGPLHTLARNFTVCDQWFASVPGPTWTNRLFAWSGTSLGRVKMPQGAFDPNLHLYDQDTIFDRLNEKQIAWRIYHGDVPLSLLLVHQWRNPDGYRFFDDFATDTQGPEANFPKVVFIEPSYLGNAANDDHPNHDVRNGQRLIAQVYNAIRSNNDLWNSTLLVILYDEHGGFYDHVAPPPATPPDEHNDEYDFTRFGVRVPALLVSPLVDKAVLHTPFDHTSLLKYVIDKWGLGPLGERTANAQTFAACIRNQARIDTPPVLAVPDAVEIPPSWINTNAQTAILLSEYLESRQLGQQTQTVQRVTRAIANAPGFEDPTKARIASFLSQQQSILGQA